MAVWVPAGAPIALDGRFLCGMPTSRLSALLRSAPGGRAWVCRPFRGWGPPGEGEAWPGSGVRPIGAAAARPWCRNDRGTGVWSAPRGRMRRPPNAVRASLVVFRRTRDERAI